MIYLGVAKKNKGDLSKGSRMSNREMLGLVVKKALSLHHTHNARKNWCGSLTAIVVLLALGAKSHHADDIALGIVLHKAKK